MDPYFNFQHPLLDPTSCFKLFFVTTELGNTFRKTLAKLKAAEEKILDLQIRSVSGQIRTTCFLPEFEPGTSCGNVICCALPLHLKRKLYIIIF